MPSDASLRTLVQRFPRKDQLKIEAALKRATEAHARDRRKDGTPYITHPIAVAEMLRSWGADADTIAAGLLHDTVEDGHLMPKDIAGEFGSAVSQLVEGVTKFTDADVEGQPSLNRKTETLRRLFEVMRSDIRAIVIKLADRLHNVRTIGDLSPDRQVRFARETLEIYYKLAYHLGLNDIRREFSDICVPIAYPKEAAELIAIGNHQLQAGKAVLATVERKLRALDHHGAISTMRLESHSLVSLMQDKQKPDFNEDQAIYLVIVTNDEDGCYTTLKNLHGLYRPRSALFRDFIASPARSGYQSLHTTVIDEADDMLDVRIRTKAMDEEEHLGMLPYAFGKKTWKGKEIEWLQRSATFDQATKENSAAFWQALQSDILQENIAVVIGGKEVQIAKNATVLDALYVGYGLRTHAALVAKRNGSPASFADILEEDDTLEATFAERHQVRFDWLSWVTTAYARTLIVESLKERSRDEKLSVGQQLLQKEFDRYRRGFLGDLSRAQQEQIVEKFKRANFEEVLVMIGEGVIPAQEIVFTLMPQRARWRCLLWKSEGRRSFQIHVTGAHLRREEILPRLANVAQHTGANIEGTDIRFHERAGTFTAIIRGSAPGQVQFGDFLSALDRTEWTSSVQTMLSQGQRIILGTTLAAAATIVALDILLLPIYEKMFGSLPWILLEVLPLLPIFGVNYYLLKLLRQYSARLRRDRWFLGLGLLIHIFGLALVFGMNARIETPSVLPLIALLVSSMAYLAYRFFQTESRFLQTKSGTPLTTEQWRALKRRKISGYSFRFFAVIIWGIQPLYLKYTPAATVAPFVRVFLMSIGIVAVSALLFFMTQLRSRIAQRETQKLEIRWNKEFFGILIGAALFTYFLNASLIFTTSTNFILFNNFSPVLALLVATIFWRHSIPYLKDPNHILWILIIFLLGSTGSSLIIYNSIRSPNVGTVLGDIFGVLAMIVDTLYVISQIRYMKVTPTASGFSINIHVYALIAITLLPLLIYFYAIGSPILSLAPAPLLWGLGAGALSGIGQALNYETFRRVDGFIAFLMFNISIFITFFIEAYVLDTFIPSWILLLGGMITIGSSVSAEFINARSERKGL